VTIATASGMSPHGVYRFNPTKTRLAGGAVVGGSVGGRPSNYGPFLVRCDRFVKAVRDGDSYRDACRYAGWKDRSSLRRARQVLPGFAARIEEARELGRAELAVALESGAGRWDPWEGRDLSDLVGEKWQGPWPRGMRYRGSG
jgi:hypothetical protein